MLTWGWGKTTILCYPAPAPPHVKVFIKKMFLNLVPLKMSPISFLMTMVEVSTRSIRFVIKDVVLAMA